MNNLITAISSDLKKSPIDEPVIDVRRVVNAIDIQPKQTLFDISIQVTGGIEYSIEMAKRANSYITNETIRGQRVYVNSSSIINKNASEYLTARKPATAAESDAIIAGGDYDAQQYNNNQYNTKHGEND